MCGITCAIALSSNASGSGSEAERVQALEKELNASLTLIEHRGPDDRGIWTTPDARIGE
jgi:asparagine synthase (glutamine-hydrolysing)